MGGQDMQLRRMPLVVPAHSSCPANNCPRHGRPHSQPKVGFCGFPITGPQVHLLQPCIWLSIPLPGSIIRHSGRAGQIFQVFKSQNRWLCPLVVIRRCLAWLRAYHLPRPHKLAHCIYNTRNSTPLSISTTDQ